MKDTLWRMEKDITNILDPETGYPVWNGLTAVTVVCDSGIMADGLSTACFVLGKKKPFLFWKNTGQMRFLQMRTTRCILQKEWKSVLS